MKFLDKLELLMEKKNIKNLHELSTKSDIPYSTLRGFYSKGTDNIKLPTLRALAKFFNCSIDYLADDDELTTEKFNNILEIIKANKKFILFTDESNDTEK